MMDAMDLKAKAQEINAVLAEPRVDLWKLRELALTEGGLVDDKLRRRAWPKLVGLTEFYVEGKPSNASKVSNRGNAPPRPPLSGTRPPTAPKRVSAFTPVIPSSSQQQDDEEDEVSFLSLASQATAAGRKKTAPPSLDAEQVARDVARCTWHLLTGTQRMRRMQMNNKHRRKVATLLRKKQRRLGSLINLTLLRTYEDEPEAPKLRYYQGYHDVASIFMSTLGGGGSSQAMADPESVPAIAASMGLDLPSAVLSQVSTTHFRDAMQINFLQLQTAIRLVLMPLISYFDPEVHDFLLEVDMEPFFALSWIITWFSHDIRDTDLVKRLFDAFLVSHPLLPLYVAVAMVCHPNNRHEVLNAEPDFAVVHNLLSNLPKNSSMVGWRYRPIGEGYVSGDEGDDDSANMSALDVSIFVDGSLEGRISDDDLETQSMVSSTVSGGLVKTPFQEILDQAMDYMRDMPPRKILSLTKQYYADETLKPMLQLAPSIVLLQPHPSWGLVSTVPADWVLKQRARQRDGRGRKRRDRSTSSTRSESDSLLLEPDAEARELTQFLKLQAKDLAVIACGYGPGNDDTMARRSKRKRRIMVASVAVAIVAMAMAVVLSSSRGSSKSCNVILPTLYSSDHHAKANNIDFIVGNSRTTTGSNEQPSQGAVRGQTTNKGFTITTSKDKVEEPSMMMVSPSPSMKKTPAPIMSRNPRMMSTKTSDDLNMASYPNKIPKKPAVPVMASARPVTNIKRPAASPKSQSMTTDSPRLEKPIVAQVISTTIRHVKRVAGAVKTAATVKHSPTFHDQVAISPRSEQFVESSLELVEAVSTPYRHVKRAAVAVYKTAATVKYSASFHDQVAVSPRDEQFVESSLEVVAVVEQAVVTSIRQVKKVVKLYMDKYGNDHAVKLKQWIEIAKTKALDNSIKMEHLLPVSTRKLLKSTRAARLADGRRRV